MAKWLNPLSMSGMVVYFDGAEWRKISQFVEMHLSGNTRQAGVKRRQNCFYMA